MRSVYSHRLLSHVQLVACILVSAQGRVVAALARANACSGALGLQICCSPTLEGRVNTDSVNTATCPIGPEGAVARSIFSVTLVLRRSVVRHLTLRALSTINTACLLLLVPHGQSGSKVRALARQWLVYWAQAATAGLCRCVYNALPPHISRNPRLKIVTIVVLLVRHLHALVATMTPVTVAARRNRRHFSGLPELSSCACSHVLLVDNDNVATRLVIVNEVVVITSVFLDAHRWHRAATIVLRADRWTSHLATSLDRS